MIGTLSSSENKVNSQYRSVNITASSSDLWVASSNLAIHGLLFEEIHKLECILSWGKSYMHILKNPDGILLHFLYEKFSFSFLNMHDFGEN